MRLGRTASTAPPDRRGAGGRRSGCTRERLTEVALGACRPRDAGAASDQPVYSCQATELTRAAPVGIPFWDLRQYVQDVRTGNAPVRQVVRGIAIGAFNRMQDLTRRTLPERLRIRGGQRYPFIQGTADKSPAERLDLQPGEWVRVKSIEQISATLNADNSNRGLSFDRRNAQVLRPDGAGAPSGRPHHRRVVRSDADDEDALHRPGRRHLHG